MWCPESETDIPVDLTLRVGCEVEYTAKHYLVGRADMKGLIGTVTSVSRDGSSARIDFKGQLTLTGTQNIYEYGAVIENLRVIG